MADPLFDKTWNMLPAKSLFSATLTPVAETRLYDSRPNGYKLTVNGTQSGKPYQWWYEAYYDGNAHPVHGRNDVDSITIYKLDAFNTVGFFENGNQPAGAYRRKISADGATLIVEAAGRGNGQPFYDVIEYRL